MIILSCKLFSLTFELLLTDGSEFSESDINFSNMFDEPSRFLCSIKICTSVIDKSIDVCDTIRIFKNSFVALVAVFIV